MRLIISLRHAKVIITTSIVCLKLSVCHATTDYIQFEVFRRKLNFQFDLSEVIVTLEFGQAHQN